MSDVEGGIRDSLSRLTRAILDRGRRLSRFLKRPTCSPTAWRSAVRPRLGGARRAADRTADRTHQGVAAATQEASRQKLTGRAGGQHMNRWIIACHFCLLV